MFSGLKDVDREILKHVNDEELVKVCSTDRKTWNEVCDDNFLKRRLMRYPGIEKYKREDESYLNDLFRQHILGHYHCMHECRLLKQEHTSPLITLQLPMLRIITHSTCLYIFLTARIVS